MSPAIPGSSQTRMSATRRGQNQPGPTAGRRGSRLVALSAVLMTVAAAASACGGSGVHAQTGPIESTPATAVSSPSTSSDPTPRQRAVAAVTAQAVAYEHTLDELAIHRHLSLDRLYRVSTQPDVTNEIAFLNRFRSRGDRQRGSSRVTASRVDTVRLPSVSGPGMATARVTICLDVGAVRAFDPSGKSIVTKSRKRFYLTRLDMVNRRYPVGNAWLVKHVSAKEQRSCSV